jgi:hypothetical protein
MEPEEEYKEFIRLKKNTLISNVMQEYLAIMYDKKKIVRTAYTRYLDQQMLRKLIEEIDKFMKDFIT